MENKTIEEFAKWLKEGKTYGITGAGGLIGGASGASLCTGAGFVLGGPIGAAIGFGIGTLSGGITGALTTNKILTKYSK